MISQGESTKLMRPWRRVPTPESAAKRSKNQESPASTVTIDKAIGPANVVSRLVDGDVARLDLGIADEID